MNKSYITSLKVIILFLIPVITVAQSDYRPTLRYESGEEVMRPMTGFKSIIPEGWSGVLPRGSELILLLPNDGRNGQVFLFADKGINMDQRAVSWMEGFTLENGNTLKSDGEISVRKSQNRDHLTTMITSSEKTSDQKGYLEASCGAYDHCLVAMLIGSPQDFESLQLDLFHFMDNLTWSEPGSLDPYEDFNWHDFLSGKYLINHEYVPGAKFENDLWLCPDGTFRSHIKRAGSLKGSVGEYKGKQSGTWETNSIGSTGVLKLNFLKLEPVEIPLEIKNEQIFVNGHRHMVITNQDCK